MTDCIKVDWIQLQDWSTEILRRAGVPEKDAAMVAESLVQANLRGVDSHGVVRIPIYVRRIQKGMVNPAAELRVSSIAPAMALVDGQNALGVVAGNAALTEVVHLAKNFGTGVVGVRNSNHFGTGAYYALKAIQNDVILVVMSNASQTMPPTGGVRPFIGTNPLTVAIPSGERQPFILDMATSVVARGKIIVAAEKGESIPEGWAIDKYGRPTTDANAALEGSVLPFGGYKGYAISLFIDMLSGVLTGAGFGPYVRNMYEDWEHPQNVGHLFWAIDINRFMPVKDFRSRMDQYIRDLKAEPKAPGFEEILIPGEIEARTEETNKRNGIQLPERVVRELNQLSEEFGVASFLTNTSK
ncbi:MAG: Ldh family oxidoreductase [Alicyclobacillus herbarius]|uniref:Ldh family oxidoreductase n=1 Tax=Alicyclobacillus herbarius TaxID=122960 RepID=UPI0023573C33|nr:Ldh family oxidoreductase [Alicyclobacillus herbarius]MCL6632568.1 Ldh family oxidoreductase [Alicyclobacillus herbarius]